MGGRDSCLEGGRNLDISYHKFHGHLLHHGHGHELAPGQAGPGRHGAVVGWAQEFYIEYALTDWLRAKRIGLGLHQQHIGDACGVSKVTVHQWECDRRSPGSYERWRAWAKAVNCRIEITVVDTNGKRHNF